MVKARLFDFSLFFIALFIVYETGKLFTNVPTFMGALLVYWFFSSMYFPLKYSNKNGSITVDYAVSYSLSFVIFAGPVGLFLFEVLYGITVYVYKKLTKTADDGEFLDTIYNIGSFVISNSICFYLYHHLSDYADRIPFGFWLLMFVLAIMNMLISATFLNFVFYLLGENSLKQALRFLKNRSTLDLAKISFTNGFLLTFLLSENWEMLISMFVLTHIVSGSFFSKAQSIQNKIERDRFEQMAYTDFLTGVANRAAMDAHMSELNASTESIAVVVADIDLFKQINDSYNHAVGDRVIQHFALTLKKFLNDGDHLFRSGGEEFTFILRHRGYEESVQVVEEIIHSLQSVTVAVEYQGAPEKIAYTASFGLFYYEVTPLLPLEKGYIQADQLLYHSKQNGRNRLTSTHHQRKPAHS